MKGTIFPSARQLSERAGVRVNSCSSGSLLMRELMDRLGYRQLFARYLHDPRDAARVRHPWREAAAGQRAHG
jgi:hypothetical protein